ncbi:hypothetical protein C4J81_19060 (plasmid) [Deltaproteobacteria bacterium Smac51]|nr:hypothetical protein C4J81_19060 [Deltaproteobacteria bacterium Smac51]
MAVSGSYLSSIYNSSALDAVGRAVKTRQEATDSFMLAEEPEEAASVGGKAGMDVQSFANSSANAVDWSDPAVKREILRMCLPPMVTNIISTGCYSTETSADRGSLDRLATKYFEEVKEEYGCSDDYMPYMPGLSEFDADIEAAMKRALYDKVEADPEAERLTLAIGGIWPPPDKLNLDTMTYGPGAPHTGATPWNRPRML